MTTSTKRNDIAAREVSATAINANIVLISKMGAEYRTLVHSTAVLALTHASIHGDVTLCGKMLAAMHSADRVETIRAWFTTYGPIKFKGAKEGYEASMRKADDKFFRPFDVVAAEAHPFWETAEVVKKDLTFEAMIKLVEGSAKRFAKAAEDGEFKSADKAQKLAALLKGAVAQAQGATIQ